MWYSGCDVLQFLICILTEELNTVLDKGEGGEEKKENDSLSIYLLGEVKKDLVYTRVVCAITTGHKDFCFLNMS